MLKSVIVFIAVLLVILFVLSNTHPIKLHFITGNPFSVRLAFLILFSYVLGVLSASYFFMLARLKARRNARNKEPEHAEDEEYL